MLTQDQINTVRASFAGLERRAGEIAPVFFAELLAGQPQLRAYLPRSPIDRARELATWLGTIVRNLNRIESISFVLEDAGQRCARAGLQPIHFGQARDALVSAMRRIATSPDAASGSWSNDTEALWTESFNVVLSVMIRGAGRARSRAA